MRVLAIDVGGTHVKILATGQKEKRDDASGPTHDARGNGHGGEEARRGLGLRCRLHRLSRARCCTTSRCSSRTTSAAGWVGFDYRKRVRQAGAHPQRRRHAGARQLRGRTHAVPRPRHRPRVGAGHRRHASSRWSSRTCRTRRARPSRTTSACAASSASARRSGAKRWSRSSTRLRAAMQAGLCRARRRQRRRSSASCRSARRARQQRQRLPRRLPHVGGHYPQRPPQDRAQPAAGRLRLPPSSLRAARAGEARTHPPARM